MSQETLEQPSSPISSTASPISKSPSELQQTKQPQQDSKSLSKEEMFLALSNATFDQIKAIVNHELNDENIDFLIAWFKQDMKEMIGCIGDGAFLQQVYTWFTGNFNNQKFSKENSAYRYDMLETFEFVNACNEVQDADGKELFFSVLKGDETVVDSLLKRGVSPNVKNARGQVLSPLVIAAWQWDRYTDNEEVADRYVRIGSNLLKRGANAAQTQQWADALCEQSASNRIKHDIWQGISELITEFAEACSPVESKASRRPLQSLTPSSGLLTQSMFSPTPERKPVAGGRSSGQKSQTPVTPRGKRIPKRKWEVMKDKPDDEVSLKLNVSKKPLSKKEQQQIAASVFKTR